MALPVHGERTSVEGIEGEIEAHSIDVIPESERHGRVRSQLVLWFATNANVFTSS